MKYRLEISVFICGAVVMILEIVGGRILAPYLGTSVIVWTGLIGIILGSLSLGYWLGGKLADKKPTYKEFSLIIFTAAIFIGTTALCKSLILILVQNMFIGIRSKLLLATAILFTPSSILLGAVSPYAVKLKIKNLDESGSTVGNLYAISTIGSILGTFLAGFVLISFLGNTKIIFLLSMTLLFTSFITHSGHIPKSKILIMLFFIFCFFETELLDKVYTEKDLILTVDTPYQEAKVFEGLDNATKRPIRYLITDNGPYFMRNLRQAVMYLDGDDLAMQPLKFFDLSRHFKPDFKYALMIGGGGYAYPRHYLKNFVTARIDVVEIDPKITELAEKYFKLTGNHRLAIYHEDGRIFLNRAKNKYDVIFVDAFRSAIPPFQLTTKEAAQKIHDLLIEDGVVLINIVSAIEGEKGKFLRAEYATFKTIFPYVYLFPVRDHGNGLCVQNIILVALKSKKNPIFKNDAQNLNEYLQHLWDKEVKTDMPILTDDYAPVENYILKIFA